MGLQEKWEKPDPPNMLSFSEHFNMPLLFEYAFRNLSKSAYEAGLSFKEFSMILNRLAPAGKRGATAGIKLKREILK